MGDVFVLAGTIRVAKALLQTLDQLNSARKWNHEWAKELERFVQNLQQNITLLQAKENRIAQNSTAALAMAALTKELELADNEAKAILKKGFFGAMWSSKKTGVKLKLLRESVMTSFQSKLLFTILDVSLENAEQQKFQRALQSDAASSSFRQKEINHHLVQRGLVDMCQPVFAAIKTQGEGVLEPDAISQIKGMAENPQTEDMEKLLAHVLAELEKANMASTSSSRKWYQDPITWDTMSDPVKGSDGHTYDRWTFLEKGLDRSPFDRTAVKIRVEDVDVRSRLFEKFPEQAQRCAALRQKYRQEALEKAEQGLHGDALLMLKDVLSYAPEDQVCRIKLQEVEQRCLGRGGGESGRRSAASLDSEGNGDEEALSSSDDEEPNAWEDAEEVLHDAGEEEEPTCLSTSSCNPDIVGTSRNRLSAAYRSANSAVSLQADRACPTTKFPFYYFELTVKDRGFNSRIAIGFSEKNFQNNLLPGLHEGSCAYHSHDGGLYLGAVGKPGAPSFQTGDTVGAGIIYAARQIFFTKNGEVIGSVDNNLKGDVFPTIGLSARHDTVRVSFDRCMQEPIPRSLDATTAGLLSLSSDLLEARKTERGDMAASIQSDKPAPCRKNFYYYEVTVRGEGEARQIAVGYTTRADFKKDSLLGWYRNSFAYHGDNGNLYDGPGAGKIFGLPFGTGDCIGAGIHYGTNELFFVKNGELVGCVPNTLPAPIFPTVALRSLKELVRLNFGQEEFTREVLPTCLNVRRSHSPVAVQADQPAPFRGWGHFYMEMTVRESKGMLAIGFSDKKHFRTDELPGMYSQSWGYHGDDGKVYTGGGEDGENLGTGFSSGDIVGAGLIHASNHFFFTKNGTLLRKVRFHQRASCVLYPTVGMRIPDQVLELNFGKAPFAFRALDQI